MAALTDGTQAGTIASSTNTGAPAGFSPLTGNTTTAKIPDAPAPTTPTQQAAFAPFTISPEMFKASVQPTVLSSGNIDTKNQNNTTTVQNTSPTGQTVDGSGYAHNADGSFASAPSTATQVTGEDGNTYYSNGAIKYATGNVSDDPAQTRINDQLSGLMASMDAAGATNISNIKDQYNGLIEYQKQVNAGENAAVYTLLARGGSLQTASSSGIIHAQISSGIQKIADLVSKENSAIIAAQQAMQDGEYKVLDKQLSIAQNARAERIKAAERVSDNILQAKKDAQAKLDAADKDIKSIIMDASKNNAPADVKKQLNDALANHDWTTAMNVGAQYTQDPTSTAGQYAAYVQDAKAKGLTPMTPGDFLSKQKSNEAYASAYASAKGKAAGDAAAGLNADGTPITPNAPDPTATGITGATGLSLAAFNYLTQGVSSMSRMPAAQRNAIMKEAGDYLNKHGVDVSTFQSQYKAYNDVLQKNIERANQTKIMAGEVSGSAEALIEAINAKATEDGANKVNLPWLPSVHQSETSNGMSGLRVANILDILAGKETNNKFAQTYITQLHTMANDLAGYLAASRGSLSASGPSESDKLDAATIIANGMNTGSIEAFRDAIKTNEEKVTRVVNKAAEDARKQVWDLFGVGSQYKPTAPQLTEAQAKDAVDTYIKSNPTKAETIAKLYEVPGATDQDILDYINLTK